MKTVVIGIGTFCLGIAVGVGLIAPRQQFDQKLVEHCRQELCGLKELPPDTRALVDQRIRASRQESLRWRIVRAIAGVELPDDGENGL